MQTPTTERRVKAQGGFRIRPGVITAAAIPVLALVLYYILSSKPAFVEDFISGFSLPTRQIFGKTFSFVPFSMMELFYTAAGVFLLVFIGRTVYLIVRRDKKLRTLLHRLLTLILVALYIFAAYSWLFGIDYLGESFAEKNGLDYTATELSSLISVTEYFAERTNTLAQEVPRGKDGQYACNETAVFDYSVHIYDSLANEFSSLDCIYYRPKVMLFSDIMSRMGFTGVYFPFTGESNINTDPPDSLMPFTIAHELAHQSGITAEDEANFVGILGCITSDSADYQYSGYLGGLIHLMNALSTVDADAWTRIYSTFSEELLADWNANNEYWASMQSSVTEVSEAFYDSYLKVNGQELGIRTYGACVDILAGYFSDGNMQI